MKFGSRYQVDENWSNNNFQPGEWECIITKATETLSRTGKAMVEMGFSIAGQGELRYWLVDDQSSQEAWERTNKNITRFFDCFNIPRGNFNVQSWLGAKGRIYIDKSEPNNDGKQFFEVQRLIAEKPQTNGYPQQRQQPQNPQAYQAYQQQGQSAFHAPSQNQQQTQGAQRNNGNANKWQPQPQQNQYNDFDDNLPF
ncbi:hypothetical protein [Treponema phagedenis]|uniref:hypothetical protein n=1 Tax=Treponema phagedenis TaxID=162 RepID=UPI0001F64328|nr:hypothetical protein [Treponema phagedenis]EFW38783.1 hypothetical protein HMPREF9554_00707 [Treponema phagedenis F0421]TYT79740.1 hypothetical protein FS559_12030 [Treponema phagedenis]